MAQRLVGMAEIALMMGVSRQRAAVIVDSVRHNFPREIDTLSMGRVWDKAVVEAWFKRTGRSLYPLK